MVSDTKSTEIKRRTRDQRKARRKRKAKHARGTPKFPIQPK